MASERIPPIDQDEDKIVKEHWLHLSDIALHVPKPKEESIKVDNRPIPISDHRKAK